jgi:hypothetical protein
MRCMSATKMNSIPYAHSRAIWVPKCVCHCNKCSGCGYTNAMLVKYDVHGCNVTKQCNELINKHIRSSSMSATYSMHACMHAMLCLDNSKEINNKSNYSHVCRVGHVHTCMQRHITNKKNVMKSITDMFTPGPVGYVQHACMPVLWFNHYNRIDLNNSRQCHVGYEQHACNVTTKRKQKKMQ